MQTWSTGPVRIWIQFPSSTPAYAGQQPAFEAPEPFGTCERGLEIVEDTAETPVMNDLAGEHKPFDISHQGTDAIAGGILTRYRESIYRRLAETPRFSATGVRGDSLAPFGLGTHLMLEGRFFRTYAEFLYGGGGPFGVATAFTHPVHAAGTLPNGYAYTCCVWKGPARHHTGTGPKKLQFLIFCHGLYDPTTGNRTYANENMAPINGLPWEVTP